MGVRGILRTAGGIRLLTRRGALATAAAALLLAGCKSGEKPKPAPGAAVAPLTAAALSPVFGVLAPPGVGPQRLMIELARPITTSAGEAAAGDLATFRLEPPVKGELRRVGKSTLAFVPSEPFAPATTYTATLVSVKTEDDKVLRGPGGGWQYRFTTPRFGLVRMGLRETEYNGQWIEVELVFSAAVDKDGIEKRAHFTVLDRFDREAPLGVVRVEQPQPNVLRLRVQGDALRAQRTVRLTLDAGQRQEEGAARAPAARDEVQLPAGQPVEVKAIYPSEGNSGWYVEMVCDDTAAGNDDSSGKERARRYYYDQVAERGFGEISIRCQFTPEELAEKLHVDPPVPFTVAPSGGGMRVFGEFKRGPVSIRLAAGARTVDGGVLHGDYETTFSIPARSPQVSFVAKGRYLPRSAWQALPLRHLNVDQVEVEVRQVPPRNLVFWMSNDENEAADERTSDLIAKRTVPVKGAPDAMTTTYVDVASWVPATTKGLLELTVRGAAAHDTARILLTDLQLVAKRTGMVKKDSPGKEVAVWAFDSKSLQPARGVEVQLLRKSGFALDSCNTGGQGNCTLKVPEPGVDPAMPFALLARSGNDLTYLKFADLKADVDEARVSGEPYSGAEVQYKAAVYGDRGVYRPGETAHLVAIVRDAKHVAPPAGMPVQLSLVDARGKVMRQVTLPVNGAGVVTLDPGFAAFAPTGRYEAKVEIGGKPAGSWSFRVEEFVPERMKVDAKPAAPQVLAGEPVQVGVDARYLFGGVPEGAKVQLACELASGTFAPKQNGNYVYGVWRPEDEIEKAVPVGQVEGSLDAAGHAALACPALHEGGALKGPSTMIARAAVFEAGSGRTTVGEARVPLHPARYYIGLASSAQKVISGQDFVVQGVVVDWNGNLVNAVGEVELELQRLEEDYGWYYDENLGEESWRRYLRPVPEDRTTVKVVNGRFRTVWKPEADASAFLVQARAGAAHTDLKVEGEGGWYWWGPEESESAHTPKPDRPTWIDVKLPDRAEVGQPVQVQLKAPFRGRILLTAETDELVASEWREVEPGATTWTFQLKKFVPNVYVTAFAVKDPRVSKEGGLMPDRAFGVASVTVSPREYTQDVRLQTPKEVRSGARLPVDLDLGRSDGPTFVTVAAVDEGILSLTRFQSPDPSLQIFTRRALGVDTFETVGWTLAVPPPGRNATGGDAAGKLGRVQPVKPVALWSGLVPVPASGKVHLDLQLPAYRGALRVMAVSASPGRMGHADSQVLVRDPLVLQVTLPRFLALHDAIDVPVAVTNMSGSRQQVAVSIGAENLDVGGAAMKACATPPCPPLVTVSGPAEQRLDLAPGASGQAVFHAASTGGVGGVALTARARAADLKSEEREELPVVSAAPKVRRVERVEIGAGDTDVAAQLRGWTPMTERTTIWVSANPYGDAFAHLSKLVHYPYGCIEQTSSTTRPLLYLSHLVGVIDPTLGAPGTVEKMVMAGVERILSMQTPAGGFGYWPGDDQPTPWGTAYATHVLIDAQRLRYSVPQGRIDDALGWMEQRINTVYEHGGRDYEWERTTAEPYMHYVLALAGRGATHKARILHLIDASPNEPRHEDREQLYMLKAALYLAGDHRYERDLRSPDVSPLDRFRENSWTFYSDLRMRGFMLSVFGDLFGRDAGGEKLASLVAAGLQGSSDDFTTQELAWGITGLGKRIEAGASDFAPPVLTADGRRLAPMPLPAGVQSSDRSWDLPRASEYEHLTVNVPRKGEGRLWLILITEGVREDGAASYGGNGLKLARRWLDAEGNAIAGAAGGEADSELSGVKLGDLVYVELTLQNTSGERMANIALVDRIPAGWEIENPRLGRSDATPEWVDTDRLWAAEHMDLRDDRIEVFGSLQKGEVRQVIYAVRAVTAGRFQLPSAEAEAMYDPRNWARVHGGTAVVTAPWEK